jgi:hypothetical protein
MPTWNQLPDGGDWLNRSQTPLSTSSSGLGSTKATVQHTSSLPSRHSSSSSNSANAAEHRSQSNQELLKRLPTEDRAAIKPPARHPLPSRPSSPKPASHGWSAANAAEHRSQSNQELLKRLPTEDREALTSSKPTKVVQTQLPSHSPAHSSGSAADFRLAEERSKSAYNQNHTKLDAQVKQSVQQIRQERVTSPEPPPEQHKSLWDNITDKGSDLASKVGEGASNVKVTVSSTAKNAWEQQQKSSFSPQKLKQDFAVGVAKGGWDAIKGTAGLAKGVYDMSPLNPDIEGRRQTSQKFGETVKSLAQNPAVQSLANPVLAAQNFASRPRETTQAFKNLGTGIAQPYVEAWKSGRPGEAVGRGFFDIASVFLPGGAVAKVGKGGQVAAVAAKTAEISSKTGTGARVAAKTAEISSKTGTGARVTGEVAGTGLDRANVFSQRLDDLSVHPRTGKPSPKSRQEAETILQAEQQGLLQGTPHRPTESRQSEGLDFELKDRDGRVIGYADTKNPIDPKFRAVSTQAKDITKKINSYQPNLNLKVVIDLKNFDSAQKLEFKAYLANHVENTNKVVYLND